MKYQQLILAATVLAFGSAYAGGDLDPPKADTTAKAKTDTENVGAKDDGTRSMGEKFDDASITAKIKSKLIAKTDIPGYGINVSSEKGVVTLEGTVSSMDEKKNVEAVAEDTKGVAKIVNKLQVVAKDQS
jgi:hyperosmotically inducible periplasmic protein